MTLTLTQADMDTAGLVLLIDENGSYRWSSTHSHGEIASILRRIADEIDMAPLTADDVRQRVRTFASVDPWGDPDGRQLEVVTTRDGVASLAVLGSRGGVNGVTHITADDALTVADMLIARYRR